jgi:hypothetical protein
MGDRPFRILLLPAIPTSFKPFAFSFAAFLFSSQARASSPSGNDVTVTTLEVLQRRDVKN